MIKSSALVGKPVVYIPQHLLTGPRESMIKHENLGIISSFSKADNHVFVRYHVGETGALTDIADLFTLKFRADLLEAVAKKFNIDVQPFLEEHCDPKMLEYYRLSS